MSKNLNTVFNVLTPKPLDARTQVSTFAGLAFIAVKYVGLKVYVVDEDAEYRYYDSGWVLWTNSSSGSPGGAVWGSITGTLSDQTDLNNALLLKFDKTGGTITGQVTVQNTVTANDFLIGGTGASLPNPYLMIASVPATSSSPGSAGQVAFDANYFYVCVATDTWKRTVIAW